MRVIKAVPPTEVDHIIQPRIEAWLKDYDYVLVGPGMGMAQFQKFGERIIVDCHDYLNHRVTYERHLHKLATKYGLSVLDNPCGGSE